MTDNIRLCEILLKEARKHGPESENPLKFIGVTFEKGRVTAVKTYCKGDGADELGFYRTDTGTAVSDNIITKDLSKEELNDRIKDYISGAFRDAPVSVADARELAGTVFAEIMADLKLTGGTLYDIGKLRNAAGDVAMLKYYIAFDAGTAFAAGNAFDAGNADNTGNADDTGNGAHCEARTDRAEWFRGLDTCLLKKLAATGYLPTMLGGNRNTDGQRETKLYLDLGKTNSVDEAILGKTKEATGILGLKGQLSDRDIEILSDNRLYLRGIGLTPKDPDRIRIYLDVFKVKRLRRQLFY